MFYLKFILSGFIYFVQKFMKFITYFGWDCQYFSKYVFANSPKSCSFFSFISFNLSVSNNSDGALMLRKLLEFSMTHVNSLKLSSFGILMNLEPIPSFTSQFLGIFCAFPRTFWFRISPADAIHVFFKVDSLLSIFSWNDQNTMMTLLKFGASYTTISVWFSSNTLNGRVDFLGAIK